MCFGTREGEEASLGLSRGEQWRLGINHLMIRLSEGEHCD